MSAQVVAFPGTHSVFDRPSGARRSGRRVYDIADMARLTGLIHVAERTLVDSLRTFARRKGMPAPITPRRHAGEILTGTAAIGMRALWDAAAVDRWLDPACPPPQGAAGHAHPVRPAPGLHEMMRSRAAELLRAQLMADSSSHNRPGHGPHSRSEGGNGAAATPEMRLLRARLQGPIKSFMAVTQTQQGDYSRHAQDAASVLCEELAVLLGCIVDPAERHATLLQIIAMMPGAVEDAHAAAIKRSRTGLLQ